MDKIIQLLLGREQGSSLAGYAVLIWSLYQGLVESGIHDYKLIAIGIGLFFILRFMNEKVPGLNSLVVEVVRQLQARQVAVGASPVAPTRPNMGTVPLTPGEQFSAPPRVDQYPSRQLEEMRLRLIQLENENAGFRAELAVNQQRTLEVQRNAASQIDLARNTDPLRTEL